MATAVQVESLWSGVTDTSGNPLVGGKVYTYSAGTTSPIALFTTPDKTSQATNPIILDSSGKAQVYADGRYKFVIKTSADATLYTLDNLLYGFDDSSLLWGGLSTGAANAQAVTVPDILSGYSNGQRISFIAGFTNTDAATLNINELGAVSIVKGASGVALANGDIVAGQPVNCTYYGGSFRIDSDPVPALTANLNFGGNIPSNLGAGTASAPAVCVGNDTNTGVFGPAADTWAVATNGSERVRVTSDGKIGIGSTAPSVSVQVSGGAVNTGGLSNPVSIFCSGSSSTSNAGVVAGSLNGNAPYLAASKLGSGTATDLAFYTNDTERMRVAANGDLTVSGSRSAFGINNIFCIGGVNNNNVVLLRPGATDGGANGATIWVYGASANTNAHNITLDTGTSGSIIFSNGGSTRMTMLSDGKLGLGMSPSYQLQLATDSAAKPSTNTWTIASDSRIKTNVEPYDKGLAEIKQVNPITYDYNGKGGFAAGPGGISIIAQDLQPVFPECISTFSAKLNEEDEEETELYNYNGHAITFALINAVKELAARVEALEGQLS